MLLSPPCDWSVALPDTESDTKQLSAELYDELCAIAHRLRRGERDEHTLQTTAVVHEAFLRLSAQHANAWHSRPYFLSAAAQTMRRLLVDYARERAAAKRDAGLRTTLVSLPDESGVRSDVLDVIMLDDLLSRLSAYDERKARIVELHVFGGFEVEEVAEILGLSARTVYRDWRFAKAWLVCELTSTE